MRRTVGIIGFGNMGSAIAEQIKSKYKVWVYDKYKEKTKNIFEINVADSLADLINQTDVIILAVKPQDFTTVLNEILENRLKNIQEKLIISIAAGITTKFIEVLLGKTRVVRVMPNLPVRVGQGISFLNKGRYAQDKDLNFALKLFRSLGIVFVLSEDMMNAATAVSGSGPGFWCHKVENMSRSEWKEYNNKFFIPELTLAAESVKFDKKLAHVLAENIVRGSLATVEAWHIEPAELKKQVASKGGTTEAGLEVLDRGGSLTEAVRVAVKRAEELSKKE